MTKRPKPCANVRRLAKLLREAAGPPWPERTPMLPEELAVWLAHRGVLAVSAETVPNADTARLVSYYAGHIRPELRRLARGGKR